MAKISDLSDGGSLLPTDDLVAVRSGANVKVKADNITVDRIDLGDNEKIRLGDSQDLEIYHSASDSIINDNGTGSLKLQQGGSTKLEVTTTGIDVTGTVTASGDVAIGTSSAGTFRTKIKHSAASVTTGLGIEASANDSVLRVFHSGSLAGFNATYSSTGAYVPMVFNVGSGGEAVRISTAGLVGINNSSPVEMLTVGDTSDTNVRVQFLSSASGANTIQFGDGTGTAAYRGYINYTHSDDALAFAAAGSEVMRLESAKVGIGTSPSAGLHVLVDTNPVLKLDRGSANTTNANLYYNGTLTGQLSAANADFQISASGASTPISFYTNGSQAMAIDASQNVGIGTTSPNSPLDVRGGNIYVDGGGSGGASQVILTTSASSGSNFGQISNTGTRWSLGYGSAIGTVGTEVLTWNSSGNLGINQSNPSTTLHVGDGSDADRGVVTIEGAGGEHLIFSEASTHPYGANAFAIRPASGTSFIIQEDGASTPAVVVDTSGRVGIGASSIDSDALLHLKSTQPNIRFEDTDDSKSWRLEAGGVFKLQNVTTASEVFRINQSDQMMLGKTSTSQTVEGIVLQGADGRINASADGNVAGIFNRLTDDGNIFLFRKDGSDVGSIGTVGTDLYIGSGGAGVRFYESDNSIIPCSDAGVASNGSIDLGDGSFRFKDLYLAGRARAAGSTGFPAFASVTDTDTGMNPDGAGNIQFSTQGSERMRIDSSGRVGIGTSSPAHELHVAAVFDPTIRLEITDGSLGMNQVLGDIEFYQNDPSSPGVGVVGLIRCVNSSSLKGQGELTFHTGTSSSIAERMRIDSDGNVGIGATPGVRLHVEGATNSNVMVVNNIGTAPNYIFDVRDDGVSKLRVDPSGNLVAGTTSAWFSRNHTFQGDGGGVFVTDGSSSTNIPLSIQNCATSGNNRLIFFYTEGIGAPTERGNIDYNRTGNQVRYNVTSDQRLKENIVDAHSASEDIDAIKVRQFDWVENGYHQSYGLIAQELLTVTPDAVSQPEDPEEMMGVDYSKLVPMMLKEIQQLRARVAQLEGAN